MENVGQGWCCMMKFNEIHKKKGLQAIFPFQDIICRIKDVTNLTMTTLQFQIAWDFWFGLRPAYSRCDFRKPLQVAKKLEFAYVFQWIAQRILQQFFEEIIHIQGGIKEFNFEWTPDCS